MELRNITKIDRMLELLIRLMARVASPISKGTEIHRMDKRTGLHVRRRRIVRIIKRRVADVAVIRDHLAGVAEVLAVMASETAR